MAILAMIYKINMMKLTSEMKHNKNKLCTTEFPMILEFHRNKNPTTAMLQMVLQCLQVN